MNVILAMSVFSVLFISLLIAAFLGRRLGRWQIEESSHHKLRILTVAETAVFTLLGLLIAFTFVGAYERFEAREMRIIDEMNSIETANSLVGLLAPVYRPALHASFREYIDKCLEIYKTLTDFTSHDVAMEQSRAIRTKIWNQSLLATQATANTAATMLFIPAVLKVFDVANSRFAVTKIHPPLVVFILLIGIALLSSFLAGYSAAKVRMYNKIYLFSYVVITSITLYVIIDLEFPRTGLIRVNSFDHFLLDVRENLLES